jgi:hypothetical protein
MLRWYATLVVVARMIRPCEQYTLNSHLSDSELQLGMPRPGEVQWSHKLSRFTSKLVSCEPVKLLLIGGSVAQGCCADPGSRFWERFVRGIQSFPCSSNQTREVVQVNLAIGAAGPAYASLCLFQNLVNTSGVDLLVVEYSTNCGEADADYVPFLAELVATLDAAVIFFNHFRLYWPEGLPPCGAAFELASIVNSIPIVRTEPTMRPRSHTTCPFAADGVHPTSLGHACLSDLLQRFVMGPTSSANGTTDSRGHAVRPLTQGRTHGHYHKP